MPPTFDHRHRVTLEETNVVGNVYFAHYLRWQGHCREQFLAERTPGVVAQLLGAELALVTLGCSCDYFAELAAFDVVELRMALDRCEGNQVRMTFDYFRVGSEVAELVARGAQSIACMRRGPLGLEPVPVPEELAAALEPYRAAGTGA